MKSDTKVEKKGVRGGLGGGMTKTMEVTGRERVMKRGWKGESA